MAVVIELCVCCSALTGGMRVTRGKRKLDACYVLFSFPIKRWRQTSKKLF